MVKELTNQTKKIATATMLLPAVYASNAYAQVSIGTTGGGNAGTTALEGLIQTWTNFFTGPLATAAILVGIVLGALLWAFAPREGGLGIVLRVFAAAVVIATLGGLLTSFGLVGTATS